MTVDKLEQLAKLSEKATQGEWSSEDGYLIGYPPGARPNGEGITQFSCAVDPNFPRSKADGEFIAALVNWYRSGGAELARDGMRYRFLRDEAEKPVFDTLISLVSGPMNMDQTSCASAWDEAIDAARQVGGEERSLKEKS